MRLETGYLLCVGMTSVILILFAISINLFIALSADRYWAICRPNSYYKLKNSRHIFRILASSFILGILEGSIPILWNNGYRDKCHVTLILTKYYLVLCCSLIFISTAIISILYTLIYRAIKSNVSLNRKKI